MRKPERSAGKVVLSDEEPAAQQLADNRVVQTERPKTPITGRLIRAVLALIIVIAALGAAMYAILVSTIVAFPNINGDTVMTIRGAYPYDNVPEDALTTVDQAPVSRGIVDNSFDIAGIPNAAVVRIIAPNNAAIFTDPATGELIVNNQPSGDLYTTQSQVLNGQYVVECVIGACGQPGDTFIMPVTHVIGEARGIIGLSGIEEIPLPATDTIPTIITDTTITDSNNLGTTETDTETILEVPQP